MIHHRPQRGILRPLGQGNAARIKICAAPNGDIYVCAPDVILKQVGGVGSFVTCGFPRHALDVCAAPNGDIYACTYTPSGSVWKLPAGQTEWIDLAFQPVYLGWVAMGAAPNGNIYLSDNNGSIWMQASGSETFTDLVQSRRYWQSIAADSAGNVYAGVNGGYIYKQTNGAGNFVQLGASGAGSWVALCRGTSPGEMYALRAADNPYRKPNGTDLFSKITAYDAKDWRGVTIAPNRAYYTTVNAGDIWKAVNGLL